MYYEVIFENGAHSVMSADSDEEALAGLNEHHRRAVNGEVGGPTGHPAERIKRVLKYTNHPADYMNSQALPSSEVANAVSKIVGDKAVGDLVSVPEVAASVRELTSPVVHGGPHDSNYKATDVGELEGSWL